MGSRVQEQRLALHGSTENSSVVNLGRRSMGADASQWVDVVEGGWKNFYCLEFLSEVAKKSAVR